MPRYVIERLFDQRKEKLTPAKSHEAMRLMREDERFSELAWEHSHIVESEPNGLVRTFCVYRAPNAELLRRHAEAVGGHEVLNVYELAGDVRPESVPPEGSEEFELSGGAQRPG